jgi:hypothetical protein
MTSEGQEKGVLREGRDQLGGGGGGGGVAVGVAAPVVGAEGPDEKRAQGLRVLRVGEVT